MNYHCIIVSLVQHGSSLNVAVGQINFNTEIFHFLFSFVILFLYRLNF